MKKTILYRIYGTIEVDAESAGLARRTFENLTREELVEGLSFSGDDVELTEVME